MTTKQETLNLKPLISTLNPAPQSVYIILFTLCPEVGSRIEKRAKYHISNGRDFDFRNWCLPIFSVSEINLGVTLIS